MTITRVKYFNYENGRNLYVRYRYWLEQHPELEKVKATNLASKRLLRVEYRKVPVLVTNA